MSNHPTGDPGNNNSNDPNNQNNGNNFFNGANPQRIWMIVAVAAIFIMILLFTSRQTGGGDDISIGEIADGINARYCQTVGGSSANTDTASTNPDVSTTGTVFNVLDCAPYMDTVAITAIVIRGGEEIELTYADETTKTTFIDISDSLVTTLREIGVQPQALRQVDISYDRGDQTVAWLMQIAIAIIPIAIIVWFLWRMMRSVRSGQDQAMNFGRSRARVSRDMERPQVTFEDVAGAEEAKEELKEVVEFLKEPEKFIRLGARVPKGVLMVGPPGTGKTLMARAVAGEAGAPFFSISGSEFVEMFVGVGASRVRDLFERAKAEAPAIIFIDEIDAVGRQRGAGLGGGHDEREQTLNQILVEMDGFENDTNVIIIAATNRPDILDPALMRPGRFDRKVTMDNPDVGGREEILLVHARGKPLAPDVDIKAIAKITAGFSGADLENLVNEAAILAARRNKKSIAMSEMQESMERVVMGPERRSRVISPAQKRKTAYHEAGHALVTHFLDEADPVHKMTIVSRGPALGFMMPLPQEDRYAMSSTEIEAKIAVMMGGRAAEEIKYGQFYTGAVQDLREATRMARAMVTQFGMSEKLGPRAYGSSNQPVFLGREMGESRDYSEEFAREIDQEVNNILQTGYQRAKNILLEHREKMETLVDILMERETLDSTEFQQIMNGQYGDLAFDNE